MHTVAKISSCGPNAKLSPSSEDLGLIPCIFFEHWGKVSIEEGAVVNLGEDDVSADQVSAAKQTSHLCIEYQYDIQ